MEQEPWLMQTLKLNSLIRFCGAAVMLAAVLISSHGFCCGSDHLSDPTDFHGESAEVCVCHCHSIATFDEGESRIPIAVLDACNHPLADEKPHDPAFVSGIDHPPKA